MNSIDILRNRIKKHMELKKSGDKFDIDAPSFTVKDVSFMEFEEEIKQAFKQKKEERLNVIQNDAPEIIEELEIEEIEEIKFDKLTIDILEKIEEKVLFIISNINLSLFQKDIINLNKSIVDDMIKTFFGNDIEDKIKTKIEELVGNIVSHEFREYGRKIKEVKDKLLRDTLDSITPVLEKSIAEYMKNKTAGATEWSMNNYIKYFIAMIDNNYLKVDKKEKKLNNEEYLYLKNLVEIFIVRKFKSAL
ncbi:MAG TPA: hypothetical protein PLI57_05680 [Spirochaetota bacterium]|nr:hypothetical protein [Spirochaetota bacterium]